MILTERVYCALESKSKWCAVSWVDGKISVIDVETGHVGTEFLSDYEIGGWRLSFSTTLGVIVTSSFSNNTVTAHKWDTGEILWRASVKSPHCLTIDHQRKIVYAGCEG